VTESRPAPPPLTRGDQLMLGPLTATITEILGHPRLVSLQFTGSPHEIWAGIAQHGHPIQYAHIRAPLALWDVWPLVAAHPVAFEPPSAGFVLNWRLLDQMHERGIQFATITHAAGISSTGDLDLDARLPLDEPYEISHATAEGVVRARYRGARVIAVGTTVVRALEHAAINDGTVRAGRGVADQKVTASTTLKVIDAILSGTHEPGTTHYELLRAFVNDVSLITASRELSDHKYRTHEFGDSIFIERAA
jgi:S-adenosylmethionine:tRNA ribosyltransferase-isomerase